VTTAEASGRRPVTLRDIRGRGRIRGTAGVLGPAFVASVAYVDPGNFATNFAGGAEQGYELVWVIVMANLMAVLVQYLSAKAGIASGRNLQEFLGPAMDAVCAALPASMIALVPTTGDPLIRRRGSDWGHLEEVVLRQAGESTSLRVFAAGPRKAWRHLRLRRALLRLVPVLPDNHYGVPR